MSVISFPSRRCGCRTYRTTQGAQFPVENANNAIFRGVEDEVVKLVVAMNDSETGFVLVGKVLLVPGDQFVEERNVSRLAVGLNVYCLSLCTGDAGEGFDLAREVRS